LIDTPLADAGVALTVLDAVDPPAPAATPALVDAELLEPHAATNTLTPINAVAAPIRYLILRSLCMCAP
jgi:hypothetical protein